MKAIIYARYSDLSQREESIEGQLRECKEYAEKHGLTILGTYIDRALSAKTDNRPEFQKMIKDSAKGLFDVVICWKLDRFARNRYDSAHYKATLRKNGVKVVSATERITEDSTGILLESLLEGYAEFYSVELSEKIMRGMKENALKCKYNGGGVPIGLYIDKDKSFQIDPIVGAIILEGFQKYAKGSTIQKIVDFLQEKGVRNKHGNPLTFNNVDRMLQNRRYIGEYIHGDTIIPGGIPQLVPLDVFNRVQAHLTKNRNSPAKYKAKERYILTGKLRCGKCGALFLGESGTSKMGRKHHYYKCGDAKRKKACTKKTVQKDWIEDIVIDQIQKIILDDGLLIYIADRLMEYQTRANIDLPLFQQQLAEVELSIKNILGAIEAGIFTTTTKARLEELEESKLDLELKIMREELQQPILTREQLLFFLQQFRKLDMTKVTHRQRLVDSYVNTIFLYEDKIVFTFNYKDSEKTLELKDLQRSDIESSVPPNDPKTNRYYFGSDLSFLRTSFFEISLLLYIFS